MRTFKTKKTDLHFVLDQCKFDTCPEMSYPVKLIRGRLPANINVCMLPLLAKSATGLDKFFNEAEALFNAGLRWQNPFQDTLQKIQIHKRKHGCKGICSILSHNCHHFCLLFFLSILFLFGKKLLLLKIQSIPNSIVARNGSHPNGHQDDSLRRRRRSSPRWSENENEE